MPQYLVAIHHPADLDPASETEAARADIAALNKEMIGAGVRKFVGGLKPAPEASAIRIRSGRQLLVSDGPYMETKEHIGGFWVLELPGMEDALEWGRKAAIACRVPVEVREFW
jgi:hypothetical protein